MRTAAHPDLYDAAAEVPRLHGTRCSMCGRVNFPPLTTGCESCGADVLEETSFEAVGVVHALATVHTYAGRYQTPFTVGEIRLTAGPLIHALVRGDVAIGDAVAAGWVVTAVDEQGRQTVEPHFESVPS